MLSKSVNRLGVLNMQFGHAALFRQSVRSFASGGQYDVCVIGGGPGGKSLLNLQVLISFPDTQ